MATAPKTKKTGNRPLHAQIEAEAIEEEVLDASLHTDRAHHDELGRTEEPAELDDHPAEAPRSPREQPAVAIDIAKIDELL
jgi:hypothetical protein